MTSKEKRHAARERQKIAKNRARVKRVLSKYRGDLAWADLSPDQFEALIAELSGLNIKYLQQLLLDLSKTTFYSEANKHLRHRVEILVLERTILK
jgi:hypothetical protein